MGGRARVGTSGWSYPHWRDGVFYPQGLPARDWLPFYARHFDTVEVNASFYRLPRREVFEAWHDLTPEGFCFAVKASRYLTHIRRLNGIEEPLKRLRENAQGLGPKLGPLLFQLPPSLPYGRERLAHLLTALQGHPAESGPRAALEVRNPTWLCPECYDLLSDAGVALCFSDWPDLKVEAPATAGFLFLRRHGPQALYASKYPEEQLRQEARRIRGWLDQGKEVFIYFNNDAHGWATEDARTLLNLLERQEDLP
jgi:uncharacterized protein YecE (DUF72 family)